MSNTENSALIALSELRNLEANRVSEIEAAKQAREEAERKAREEAERKARAEAERLAREEAERLAKLAAEKEAREREERLRLQEADLRARAEQEARLKEEQMRLDAQVKLAEKKAKPVWLYVTIGVLVVALGVGVWQAIEYTNRQEEETRIAREEQARKDAETKAAMDKVLGELRGLKDEQARLEKEKSDLDKRLSENISETERQRLLAEKKALDDQLAANETKQKTKRSQTKPSGGSGGGDDPPKSKGGITVKKNVDDPLDGL